LVKRGAAVKKRAPKVDGSIPSTPLGSGNNPESKKCPCSRMLKSYDITLGALGALHSPQCPTVREEKKGGGVYTKSSQPTSEIGEPKQLDGNGIFPNKLK